MPEKKPTQNSKGSTWWVPALIGLVLLVVPGGVFISPVFFIISAIIKARKPKEKSPETPHSPLPLIRMGVVGL
jgi:hypothetical protein